MGARERTKYFRGAFPGAKYGIWNNRQKCFQFGICEDSPNLAKARLAFKIGDDAYSWRFEPKLLPQSKNNKEVSSE